MWMMNSKIEANDDIDDKKALTSVMISTSPPPTPLTSPDGEGEETYLDDERTVLRK